MARERGRDRDRAVLQIYHLCEQPCCTPKNVSRKGRKKFTIEVGRVGEKRWGGERERDRAREFGARLTTIESLSLHHHPHQGSSPRHSAGMMSDEHCDEEDDDDDREEKRHTMSEQKDLVFLFAHDIGFASQNHHVG